MKNHPVTQSIMVASLLIITGAVVAMVTKDWQYLYFPVGGCVIGLIIFGVREAKQRNLGRDFEESRQNHSHENADPPE